MYHVKDSKIMDNLEIRGSVNFFAVTGIVCTKCEFKKSTAKRLYARVRIKIKSHTGTHDEYVDLFGFGDIAQEMNLVCRLGNLIYVEAHLTNKQYVNKKGQLKAKMYFMVDLVEMKGITCQDSLKEADEALEILDELDPHNYLS